MFGECCQRSQRRKTKQKNNEKLQIIKCDQLILNYLWFIQLQKPLRASEAPCRMWKFETVWFLILIRNRSCILQPFVHNSNLANSCPLFPHSCNFNFAEAPHHTLHICHALPAIEYHFCDFARPISAQSTHRIKKKQQWLETWKHGTIIKSNPILFCPL